VSVAAWIVGIRKVVKPRVEAEIVEIREGARAGIKKRAGGKIIEVDAMVGIIGIKEILEAQVNMVDEMLVREVAVVAKGRAVGELEILPAASQRDLTVEKGRVRSHPHVINVFFVLARVRVEIERRRIRHVATGVI